MSTMNLKDAKDHFIESGRLNRNVVRDDVSISWYKCRLSQLSVDQDIGLCQNNKKTKSINKFDPGFIDYLDSIIKQSYDFVIADLDHSVIFQRLDNGFIKPIQCIEELCIGTNAGALTLKSGTDQIVLRHEHYLNSLSELFSYAIPIRDDDEVIGVIMLISDFQPPEMDATLVKENIKKYDSRRTKTIEVEMKDYRFEDYFVYPENYKDSFVQNINRLSVVNTPVLIMGERGSGKTTLAWYLCMINGLSPYFIDGMNIPRTIEKEVLKKALYQYDTIVIDNFESLSSENKQLLTVYTEEKIIIKTSEKYSNYNARNIILTTSYTNEEFCDKADLKLLNRFLVNTIKLRNLHSFVHEHKLLLSNLLHRNDLRITDNAADVLLKQHDINSFRDLSEYIERIRPNLDETRMVDVSDLIYNKENKMQSLEEQEKQYVSYVYQRMENNVSATADVLKIGRSTLYRKLEKYQIETLDKNSK